MKFSRSLLAVTLALSATFGASAGTYTYQDQKLDIDFKGKEITSTLCELKDGKVVKKSCRDSKASVADLTKRLEARIDEASSLLKDKKELVDIAKKQAKAKDAVIIKDEASGSSYVMLTLAKGFNLPLDLELVEKGDFSLVTAALDANKSRYEDALKVISSGKLPKDKDAKRYADVSSMLNLQNIIEYSTSI